MAWFVVAVLAVLGAVVGLIRQTIRGRGRADAGHGRARDREADPQSLWREMQIEAVRFVTEAPSHPGYRIVVEKRRIGTQVETRQDAELELRLKAARLGANGVTGLSSTTRQEKYQAGVGPKGNPYFRTREVREWEGTAVAAVPLRKRGWLARVFGSRERKLAVLDGSNMLHAAGQGADLGSVQGVSPPALAEGTVRRGRAGRCHRATKVSTATFLGTGSRQAPVARARPGRAHVERILLA